MALSFEKSKNFVLHFGKYKGSSIDEIAEDDDGLRYLDWLRGDRHSDKEVEEYGEQARLLDQALVSYLNDPTIVKELEEVL